MKIVADENIPLLMECFGAIGNVVALPGRTISADDLKDADALLVRSITRVDKTLLENSPVKFVGTATAGHDHLDCEYLASRNITFTNAPGCNARAVVEYVLAALDVLAERDGFDLRQRTVGVIGKGQVGGRLYEVLRGLGVKVYANDPLCEPIDSVGFLDLESLIDRCDIICLHTPLTREGDYPSYHLIGTEQLARMKPGTILINAGRGPVVDNRALKKRLQDCPDLSVVLDVWEFEPDVDPGLMQLVDIATPHIAGYSLDGKIAGTGMIYKALCQSFGLPARVRLAAITPDPVLKNIGFSNDATIDDAHSIAIRAVYDIRRDDGVMRKKFSGLDQENRKIAFDLLRRNYPVRREFSTLKVQTKKCTSEVQRALKALNFKVDAEH